MTKRIVQVVIFLIVTCIFGRSVAQESNSRPSGTRGGRVRLSLGETLKGAIFSQGDSDENQRLTKKEFSHLADAWFEHMDTGSLDKLSQEDFLSQFEKLLQASQGTAQSSRRRRGFLPSPFLGLFVAMDADRNGSLTRAEMKTTFERWFDEWDSIKSGDLNPDAVTTGLNSSMPRTNMGRGVGQQSQNRIPGIPKPPPSPVLPPEEAMTTLRLPDGFRMELMVHEPLIQDPIALSFDEDGRLFVLEMRGFQLDIDRTGERDPIGRITVLEDTDRDGRFDKSGVFVDQLIIPRSIAAIHGGVMYVSDYKLYFAKDTDGDGKADLNQLVDAEYGRGNVEHAPNGLMLGLDNWIYNARSQFRYRWMGDVLVKQRTEIRGQWGITQDNYGRLFFNVNNSQLLGDYTPPNYMGRNPNHRSSAGLNLFVSTDQRVFTIRMNTAINRGYLMDVLDASGRAYVFASSCSPVIYRGDNYPEEFIGNAFVCDPAVNLIKRNLVFDENLTFTSTFAYDDFEFLASTDERFRPVNLFNGPDGTLWVVDMYRGIAQYTAFMTPYLRRETLERGLEKGIHFGRIYRIVSTQKKPGTFPQLSKESSHGLVKKLSHPNGWIRDTAQRLLIEKADRSIVPELARLARTPGENVFGRIHALWSLEGLLATLPKSAALSTSWEGTDARLAIIDSTVPLTVFSLHEDVLNACFAAIDDSDPKIRITGIRVAESLTAWNPEIQGALLQKLAQTIIGGSPEVSFQAILSAGNLAKPAALPILVEAATRQSEHSLLRHATISGLGGWELQFLRILLSDPQWQDRRPGRETLLEALASAVMSEGEPNKTGMLLTFVAGQKSDHTWRQLSLLNGIMALAQNRGFEPIPLAAEPRSLQTLANSTNPQVREQSERIKKLFSWPGHQNEAVVTSRNATRPVTPEEISVIAAGRLLFEQACAACHGLNGEGIRPLAPPLTNSDWIRGSENRLIRIALNGVAGPIHVDGIKYEPPLTLPDMPAMHYLLNDTQIASVLSYVRSEWGDGAALLSPDQIAKIRSETKNRETPWTEEELLKIK